MSTPPAAPMAAPIPALGWVLAGGRGERMGGVDKGLLPYRGRPLVAWVIDTLRPQVAQVAINANRSVAQYAAFGLPVYADDAASAQQGPLSGLLRGLQLLPPGLDWLWTVPCDGPLLPPTLGSALWSARGSAPAVLPQTPDGRLHPTHALLARRLQPELQALLAGAGGRSAARWLMAQGAVALPWPDALPNCNTPDSLQT